MVRRYNQSISMKSFALFLCSDAGALSTCKTLDTNNEEAAWEDMDVSKTINISDIELCYSNLLQSMSTARYMYGLVSYGDAVYAIGIL